MDLIVPIRDRRQHRRFLTIKNLRNAAIGLLIFFAGITIESNLRRPAKTDDYGRLLGKQVHGHPVVEPPKPQIVAAPIEDQTSADPLLVDAQRRGQWLSVEPATTVTTTQAPAPAQAPGIVVTRQSPQASQPLLSGGIFRQ